MLIKSNEIARRIKDNEDNLFLLYGEEDYVIDRQIQSIKKKYLDPGFIQMDSVKLDFGGRGINLDTLIENMELPSWASKKRIVEVVNFTFDKNCVDKLPDILKSIPQGTVLIMVTDKIDKRKKKLYDAFLKNGIVCEINYYTTDELLKMINNYFKALKISISPDVSKSIISRYNCSMRLIGSALRSLSLYCQAVDASVIDMDIVEELCIPDINANIFWMMDSVGKGEADKALVQLDNLIKLKEPLPHIRFMIGRHFRELICAKELMNSRELIKRTGIRDFAADKLISQARRFSMERLLALYKLTYENDKDLKHGKVDERASLETFIVLASGK